VHGTHAAPARSSARSSTTPLPAVEARGGYSGDRERRHRNTRERQGGARAHGCGRDHGRARGTGTAVDLSARSRHFPRDGHAPAAANRRWKSRPDRRASRRPLCVLWRGRPRAHPRASTSAGNTESLLWGSDFRRAMCAARDDRRAVRGRDRILRRARAALTSAFRIAARVATERGDALWAGEALPA
jgi:hypothetical protein